jgi:hypothetical protein
MPKACFATTHSRFRHFRCSMCFSRGLHVSTFLPRHPSNRFVLPGLFTIGLDPIASVRHAEGVLRHDGGSDSSPARTRRRGLSASFALPSEHPAPNHVVCPDVALAVTSAHRVGPSGPGFASLRQARLTHPPKRVRHPAGCSFASGCSPPRIAATQLPLASQVMTSHGLDFHQPDNATSRTHRNSQSLCRRREGAR